MLDVTALTAGALKLMDIRRLVASESRDYRAYMLEAYERHPDAGVHLERPYAVQPRYLRRNGMKSLQLGTGFIVWMLAATVPLPVAAQPQDEAAIRQVQVRQAAAWNQHDAGAYARLFTEDGDVVNVVGWWWKGRSEIERKLGAGFAFVFAQSTLTITDVHVRFLNPTTAIAHVRWTMSGARTPPGIPEPREGIQLQILTRQANDWLIASFQNTNSVPETPFPAGPPTLPPAKP